MKIINVKSRRPISLPAKVATGHILSKGVTSNKVSALPANVATGYYRYRLCIVFNIVLLNIILLTENRIYKFTYHVNHNGFD